MTDSLTSKTTATKYPHETAEQLQHDAAELYHLSLEERGRMIESACRSAAEIYRSRKRAGLPDVQPAPWPASTLELLRKYAPNARR